MPSRHGARPALPRGKRGLYAHLLPELCLRAVARCVRSHAGLPLRQRGLQRNGFVLDHERPRDLMRSRVRRGGVRRPNCVRLS